MVLLGLVVAVGTIGVDDVAVGAVAVKNVAVFMLTRASLFRFFRAKVKHFFKSRSFLSFIYILLSILTYSLKIIDNFIVFKYPLTTFFISRLLFQIAG